MNAPALKTQLGLLPDALDYAARGWRVFPAPPGMKKGYKKADDHAGRRWGNTSDPTEIVADWSRWPSANIGITCGPESGLFVIEADTVDGHGVDGVGNLAALITENGGLPDTIEAVSPSGSRHLYFGWPDGVKISNSESQVAPGVDVRGEGGMVIAPPSVKPGNAVPYRWLNPPGLHELAPCPPWLLLLCLPKERSRERPAIQRTIATETDEQVLSWLYSRPNNLDRPEWVRLGFALKHHFGDRARDAWLSFSSRYSGGTIAGEAERQWETSSPDGSVDLGTAVRLLGGFETRSDRPARKEHRETQRQAKQEREPHVPAYKRGISAVALMAKHFAPVNYVVPGLMAEGATLFGGKPKIGKSWMAYDFALAIASGRPVFGSIPVTQGDVLYLALEDSERRLKSRLLKKGIRNPPERLTLATEWPDLDNGCIEELEAWADSVERPSLVIVDVLKMVRGVTRQTEQLYESDYRAMTGLGAFARNRGLAVLIVHHVRKMEADDPLESLSGTNGLTGAADCVMVLKRDIGTGNCILYVRGRDIEEAEKAVRFEAENGTWQLLGAAQEVGRTSEREAIMEVLRKSAKPLAAREISDILGKNYDAVRKTLARMAHADEVEKQGRQYACPTGPIVPENDDWDIGTHGTGGEISGEEDPFDPRTWDAAR